MPGRSPQRRAPTSRRRSEPRTSCAVIVWSAPHQVAVSLAIGFPAGPQAAADRGPEGEHAPTVRVAQMMRDLRLTVLGSCGGFPEPGRACNGFLLEHGEGAIVLDLGYGTLPRLLAARPDGDVDAVIITHEHPDHCIDLHALFRMRLYGGDTRRRIPLYCPPGVLDRLAGIEPDVDLRAVFDVRALPGSYDVGPVRLTSMLLPHFVDNAGIRLDGDHLTLAYTGDTAPVSALADLGRDADLFVIEATDRPGELSKPTRNLLTAAEAGSWGTAAGAKRLLLTHFWPGSDREDSVRAAKAHFAGEVLAAEEGLILDL